MRKILQNSFMIFALSFVSYQIIVKISSHISMHVGAQAFGQYTFTIKVIHFISHILLIGQDYALFYFISRYLKEKSYPALSGYVHWVFRSLFFRSAVLIILGLPLFYYGTIQAALFVGLFIIPVICVDTILNKFLLFKQAYSSSFIPRAIAQTSIFSILILSLQFFSIPYTILNMILCYGASFIFCCIIYLIIVQRHRLPLEPNRDFSEKKSWLKNGMYIAISTFVIALNRTLIYFILQYYDYWSGLFSNIMPWQAIDISRESIGYLAAISTITFTYHLYTKSTEQYLKPLITAHMAKNSYDDLQKDVIQANRIRYLIVWAITLWILLDTNHHLMPFGLDYLHATSELILSTICYHIYTICQPALDVMVLGGHQKIVARILQIKLLVIFILAFILIPQYGLMGAIIADSLPAALSALCAAVWAHFHLPIRILAIR